MVGKKHELDDLQQLSKQNYSNLSEILTVIIEKMALNTHFASVSVSSVDKHGYLSNSPGM